MSLALRRLLLLMEGNKPDMLEKKIKTSKNSFAYTRNRIAQSFVYIKNQEGERSYGVVRFSSCQLVEEIT